MKKILLPALLCLTLGLAPFSPEPHLIGKLRWLIGGGEGMGFMDYFDIILHGAPWIWLFITVGSFFKYKKPLS